MGPCEQVVEQLIRELPIKCKHNPYYAGSFNGNDCIRLVENMDFILDSLNNNFATDEKLQSITMRFREVWNLWKSILPTVRAARKLSSEEIEQLNVDVEAFCKTYKEKTNGSITIKLHILAAHLAEQIATFGTIGMFCEDSLESIHAIVNSVARVYSMAPPKERAGLVFKSLHARKRGKRNDDKLEKSKKKLTGSGTRKRQGKNKSKLEEIRQDKPSHLTHFSEKLKDSLYNDLFMVDVDKNTQEKIFYHLTMLMQSNAKIIFKIWIWSYFIVFTAGCSNRKKKSLSV